MTIIHQKPHRPRVRTDVRLISKLALGVALAGGWTPQAWAQAKAQDADVASLGEVVVTARRVAENLQNVPMTVTAVTDADLKKFNLYTGADLAAVAPGLTLTPRYGMSDPTVSIRGVAKGDSSGAEATVQTYLNEAPVNATLVYQSAYDIGQIEVLRGPQGTLRGQPASSGAVTFTTARPDMSRYTGSVALAASDLKSERAEAAVSLPIVADVFAVRLAALRDHSNYSGVRSLNYSKRPSNTVGSWRASLRFTPSDELDVNVMYQHDNFRRRDIRAVGGTGYRGPNLPANFNGPPIADTARLAVARSPEIRDEEYKTLTVQVNYDLSDSLRVSYVGSRQTQHAQNYGGGGDDIGNFFPIRLPSDVTLTLDSRIKTTSHELRLQSSGNRLIDYGVGLYYLKYNTENDLHTLATYLPGVFGVGANQSLNSFSPYYSYIIAGSFPIQRKTKAVYANATVHLTPRTDLFVGVRHTEFTTSNSQSSVLINGVTATGVPSAFCSIIPSLGRGPAFPSPVRVGQCDLPLADVNISAPPFAAKYKPWVYTGSLTQRFSDNVTGYVSYGRSWRPGVVNPSFNSTDPRVLALQQVSPEKSDNYEAGLKMRLFDRRLAVNAAVFHQTFKGFIYAVPFASYLSNTAATPTVATSNAIQANANAKVRGFDLEATYRPSTRFYVAGSVNYARGRLSSSLVPCNDSNFDGVPDNGVTTVAGFLAAGVPIAMCRVNDATSRSADWYASVQAEYNLPLTDNIEGYVRTLSTYTPKNRYAAPGFTSDSYALINLYIGARSDEPAWDIGAYVKNLANTKKVVYRGPDIATPSVAQQTLGVGTSTGYHGVSLTPRREVGVTARYSF